MKDKLSPNVSCDGQVIRGGIHNDNLFAEGVFTATCYDKDGNLKWSDTIQNTVATVGKNLAFNTFLNGSSYTVTGPYMGLISSTSFTATAAGDTMASHSGWLEAGNANTPTYTPPRATCVWASASAGAIALTAALNFAFTGSGTVEGCFITYGSGAVTTIDSTAGTLWSAGTFSGGTKTVGSGDQLNVSYSVSM